MDYSAFLKIIKELVMRLPAWRLIWLSLVFLVFAGIWKAADILNALAAWK
ncbi:hypothetical protein [Neisseria animalis]|nr:hypothetical protein [Neisseria animalis]